MKRLFLILIATLAITSVFANGTSEASSANDEFKWPTHTVEIVVPASAGGANDLHARCYAKYMEQIWGVPVVVTNMKSGGQAPAFRYVHDAAPDGHTILHTHDAFFINQVNGSIDFGLDDMTVYGITNAISGQVLVANKNRGWNSFEDMIAEAKAHPDTIKLGMSIGSTTQVMSNMLIDAGVPVRIVDTSGASERVAMLLGGHIDLAYMGYADLIQYPDFMPLCLAASKREAACPDIPTAREFGIDMCYDSSFFMLGTPNIDQRIVDKVIDTIKQINTLESYKEDTYKIDMQDPLYVSPEEARPIMDSTVENLKKYTIM